MKKTICLAVLSILSVLLVFQAVPVAFSQTYVPGGEEPDIFIANVILKNGDSGSFNVGELISFDRDVAINGIYDTKNEVVQEEYSCEVKKGDIWDTSNLATGIYIAYNTGDKAWSWIVIAPFIPSDAEIKFSTARQATVGDNIIIEGKTNINTPLSVVLTSKYEKWNVADNVIVDEGKFNATIDTSNLPQGTYKLMVFYDEGKDGYQPLDPHATNRIVLSMPEIALASISKSTSTDSHISLSGFATGTKEVDIWICGNGISGLETMGTPGGTFDGAFNIDDVKYWFTKQGAVTSPTELKRGEYAVLVVNPGPDGPYRYKNSLERTGMLLAMPQGVDRFLTNMGISDNLDMVDISVVSIDLPYLRLKTAELTGNDVTITGETNLSDGTLITVLTPIGRCYSDVIDRSFTLTVKDLGEGSHKIEVFDDMNTAYDEKVFAVSKVASTSVDKMPIMVEETIEKEGINIPIWIYIILGVVIAGGLAYIFLKKKD